MKYLLFILTVILFTSCDSHSAPNDNISFGQAMTYSWTLTAYVVWVVIALVGGVVGGYLLFKNYQKNQDWSVGMSIILFVMLALILAAFLATPASIAANTTVEQAARGVYIR